MNATQKLLERVRKITDTGSDYAVAKALRISVQRMSLYMKGSTVLHDDEVIIRAADLLGDDQAALLAEFHAERAISDSARVAWRRLAKLARQHATVCLLLAGGAGVTVSPSPTAGKPANSLTSAHSCAQSGCILC